jgi:hypothetical protein
MLISLQEAAAFLNTHHAVFDELWRRRDETLAEAELLALISATRSEATPAYLLTQLKRMRFMIETDAQEGAWELAPAFARWVEYLQQIAQPVSSARVRGQLLELEHALDSFRLAEMRDDLNTGREILRETRAGFQRLSEDMGQTQAAIAAVVSEAKGEHRKQGALERFRRINRLWNEYLLPMLELLDPAGQLEAVCIAWETQLNHAVEKQFLPERRLAERIERDMRGLRVAVRQGFRECQNELEPLHARLRRDTLWAEGAARILKRVEDLGAPNASLDYTMPTSNFRYVGQMSEAALVASAARWRDISEPPPVIDFAGAPAAADSQAVEDVLAAIETMPTKNFPLQDLLAWLSQEHGARGFHPVLQVFSLLVTDSRYQASFHTPISIYDIAGGSVRCGRVRLQLRKTS